MKFKATEDQVKDIAINAIKASKPMGMGMLHYNPSQEFKREDLSISHMGLNLDYVQGRMVKLYIRNKGQGVWELDRAPDPEYQSWVTRYQSNEDLIKSVEGIEIIEDEHEYM